MFKANVSHLKGSCEGVLHEDFQASGWVDISRSIANFSAFLLVYIHLFFTKSALKLITLHTNVK